MRMLLHCKSKKGITLVELLLSLILIGLVLQGVLQLMVYGFDSYKTDYNFVKQEKLVTDTINVLRKDIELASSISLDDNFNGKTLTLDILNFTSTSTSKTTKVWSLDSANKSLNLGTTQVINGIDVSNSKFQLNSDGRLVLIIKPIETNKVKNKNRNFLKPIVTEFSVRYKYHY